MADPFPNVMDTSTDTLTLAFLDNASSVDDVIGSNQSGPFDDGLIVLDTDTDQTELVDTDVFETYLLVLNVFCDAAVSLLGMTTNSINIGVFLRMGIWNDGNTMGLLALAISDFFYLLSLLGVCICWITSFLKPVGIRWDPASLEYVVFGRSLTVFSDTTCWLTAFLAIQKCLCVLLPIKFKTLVSPTRNLIIFISIFALSILSQSHLFYSEKLMWMFDPAMNDTKLYAVFLDDHDTFMSVTYFLNVVVLRTITVLLVCVCTRLTAWKVGKSLQWRRNVSNTSATSFGASHQQQQQQQQQQQHRTRRTPVNASSLPGKRNDDDDDSMKAQNRNQNKQQQQPRNETTHQQQPKQQQQQQPKQQQQQQQQHSLSQQQSSASTSSSSSISLKELKMIKIITQICIIFVACYALEIVVAYASVFLPGLQYRGSHHRVYSMLYYACFFLGGVNAAINIFVYFSLSSKYRLEFQRLVGCCKRRQTV